MGNYDNSEDFSEVGEGQSDGTEIAFGPLITSENSTSSDVWLTCSLQSGNLSKCLYFIIVLLKSGPHGGIVISTEPLVVSDGFLLVPSKNMEDQVTCSLHVHHRVHFLIPSVSVCLCMWPIDGLGLANASQLKLSS